MQVDATGWAPIEPGLELWEGFIIPKRLSNLLVSSTRVAVPALAKFNPSPNKALPNALAIRYLDGLTEWAWPSYHYPQTTTTA